MDRLILISRENEEKANQSSKRVPFIQLDQVDSDFAMALALQEQERVFSMLETIESNNYGDNGASYDQSNNNDYEYFEHLEAGGDLGFHENMEDNDEYDDDEFNPNDLSYEELIALGEIIGVEKRGLSEKEISSRLVPFNFQSIECRNGIDRCVICQVKYEDDEGLVALPNCKHPYHSDRISKWLQMKKICPIYGIEISSVSSSSQNARNVV